MTKTYHIKTFGCQMNHSDSERISGFLEMHGFSPTSDIKRADLVIFNTCGVRQMAEDRVYGQIHNLKESHPDKKIVLTGCLANRKDVMRRLKDKVDLFSEIKDIPENLKTLLKIEDDHNGPYLEIVPKYKSSYTASVPIMTGCDNFCSYCVVPYARGREVSRPAEDIIREIKSLIKNGCKEIILLGQNVNSYKHSDVSFPKLLQMIEKIPGKFWLSFMSAHPKDYSDDLIKTIAKSKKICELIHLPLQSGNDMILSKMNRKYTKKQYLSLARKIKSAMKKHKPETPYAITSDIIVGFPGETRSQLEDSADVMRKVKYDMVYFGQFSPRPGTAAWKLKDNVSKKEKTRRENLLNEILKKTTSANNKKYVGKIMEVLVGKKEEDGSYFARTRTGKHVKIKSGKKELVGKFVKAEITKANTWNLEGKIK